MTETGTQRDRAARRYHRRQFLLSVVACALTFGVLAAWIWTGGARGLGAALAERAASRPLVVALMGAAVGGSATLLGFPLDVLRGFLLPRRAGLLAQPFRSWLADRVKRLALGVPLALGALEIVYGLLAWSPARWWLWGAAALALTAVLLAAVVPLWILSLFSRLTPLADAALRQLVLDLARRVGVRATEVVVVEASRRGRTANAAVVGLGRTRRIVVTDTLLQGFSHAELEVVLAHELAHHARGHLPRGLALHSLLLVAILALADRALGAWAAPLGFAGPADPAGLPFLGLVLAGLSLLATPLAAAWSRRLEREADRVALEVTGAPEAFVAAMERLAALNLAERRSGRLREWLSATHPSPEARIAVARAREGLRQAAGEPAR